MKTIKIFTKFCSLFCFTETHVELDFHHIEEYEEGWADIHQQRGHGLAICYNKSKVKIIKQFQPNTTLEILPILI